jgi:hypothetical protein
MHKHQDKIDLGNRAFVAVSHLLPDDLSRDVDDCINRFDEWGLGMEVLIDQISEFEIKITPEQFRLIQTAMAARNMGDDHRVNSLRDHDMIAGDPDAGTHGEN